jgi:hypothetical protein
MLRSIRWLDRCIAFHKASGRDKPPEAEPPSKSNESPNLQSPGSTPTAPPQNEKNSARPAQNLFAIIQGGLDTDLRIECLEEMVKRKEDVPGYAIGGLSGGEEKGTSCQLDHAACANPITFSPWLRYILEDVCTLQLGIDLYTNAMCSMKLCTDRLPDDRAWLILPPSQVSSNAHA